jgi:hypothetical protein
LLLLIAYLLLELLRRLKAKGKTFVETIRICLSFRPSLDHVILRIQPLARSIRKVQQRIKFDGAGTLF